MASFDGLRPPEQRAAIRALHTCRDSTIDIFKLHPSDAHLYHRSIRNPTPSQLLGLIRQPRSVAAQTAGNELFRLWWRGTLLCDGLLGDVQKAGGLLGLLKGMGSYQATDLLRRLSRVKPSPEVQHMIPDAITGRASIPHVPPLRLLSLLPYATSESLHSLLLDKVEPKSNVRPILGKVWLFLARSHPEVVRRVVLDSGGDGVDGRYLSDTVEILLTRQSTQPDRDQERLEILAFLDKLLESGKLTGNTTISPDDFLAYIWRTEVLLPRRQRFDFVQSSIRKMLLLSHVKSSWKPSPTDDSELFERIIRDYPVSESLLHSTFAPIDMHSLLEVEFPLLLQPLSSAAVRFQFLVFLYRSAEPSIDLLAPVKAASGSRPAEPHLMWEPTTLALLSPADARLLLRRDQLSPISRAIATPNFPSLPSAEAAPLELALLEVKWAETPAPNDWNNVLLKLKAKASQAKEADDRYKYASAAIDFAARSGSVACLRIVVEWALDRFLGDQSVRTRLVTETLTSTHIVDTLSSWDSLQLKPNHSGNDLAPALDIGDALVSLLLDHTRKALRQPDCSESEYSFVGYLIGKVLEARFEILRFVRKEEFDKLADRYFRADGDGLGGRVGLLGAMLEFEELRIDSFRTAQAFAPHNPVEPFDWSVDVDVDNEERTVRIVKAMDTWEEDRLELYQVAHAKNESSVAKSSTLEIFDGTTTVFNSSRWPSKPSWQPRYFERLESTIFNASIDADSETSLGSALEKWLVFEDPEAPLGRSRTSRLRRFGDFHKAAIKEHRQPYFDVFAFDHKSYEQDLRPELFEDAELFAVLTGGLGDVAEAIVPPEVGDMGAKYVQAVIKSSLFSRTTKRSFAAVLSSHFLNRCSVEDQASPVSQTSTMSDSEVVDFSLRPSDDQLSITFTDALSEISTRELSPSNVFIPLLSTTIVADDLATLVDDLRRPLSKYASEGDTDEQQRMVLQVSKAIQFADDPLACLPSAIAILKDRQQSPVHRQIFRVHPILSRLTTDQAGPVLLDLVREVQAAYANATEGVKPDIKITTVKLLITVIDDSKHFLPSDLAVLFVELAAAVHHPDISELIITRLIGLLHTAPDKEFLWSALSLILDMHRGSTRPDGPLVLPRVVTLFLDPPAHALPESDRPRWFSTFTEPIIVSETRLRVRHLQQSLANLGLTSDEIDWDAVLFKSLAMTPSSLFRSWWRYLPIDSILHRLFLSELTSFTRCSRTQALLERLATAQPSWREKLPKEAEDLQDWHDEQMGKINTESLRLLLDARLLAESEELVPTYRALVSSFARSVVKPENFFLSVGFTVTAQRESRLNGDTFVRVFSASLERHRSSDDPKVQERLLQLEDEVYEILEEVYTETHSFSLIPSLIAGRLSLLRRKKDPIKDFATQILAARKDVLAFPTGSRFLPYFLQHLPSQIGAKVEVEGIVPLASALWLAEDELPEEVDRLELSSLVLRGLLGKRLGQRVELELEELLGSWRRGDNQWIRATGEALSEEFRETRGRAS